MDTHSPNYFVFRTKDASSWHTPISNIVINYMQFKISDESLALIDPSLNYIYIPKNDFKKLIEFVAAFFPEFRCSFRNG